jgi:hypothetical protein
MRIDPQHKITRDLLVRLGGTGAAMNGALRLIDQARSLWAGWSQARWPLRQLQETSHGRA